MIFGCFFFLLLGTGSRLEVELFIRDDRVRYVTL